MGHEGLIWNSRDSRHSFLGYYRGDSGLMCMGHVIMVRLLGSEVRIGERARSLPYQLVMAA